MISAAPTAHASENPAMGPSVWFGMIGAPSVWALDLTVRYPLVEKACAAGADQTWLHVLSGVFFVSCVLCGLICWLDWRAVGVRVPAGEDPGPISRRQFAAAVGVLASVLFSLIIIAEALPGFFLDPCIQ